jgi:Saxitoxin biosynthesis operon protein SxtJ
MSASNPFQPTDRLLRQFSVIWIVFFSSVAAWQAVVNHRYILAGALSLLAITVGPVGIAFPRLIKPIFLAWMTLAYPIGWVISHITLGVVFFLLFTPLAIVFRLMRRDALGLKRNSDAPSYWTLKSPPIDKARYLHQS